MYRCLKQFLKLNGPATTERYQQDCQLLLIFYSLWQLWEYKMKCMLVYYTNVAPCVNHVYSIEHVVQLNIINRIASYFYFTVGGRCGKKCEALSSV